MKEEGGAALLWVVFEGIDGSGKTSQAGALARHLRRLATVPVIYRHVFDTDVGGSLKQLVINCGDLSTDVEILLLACARLRYMQEVLQPASEQGSILLTDRFFDSIWAMQGIVPDGDAGLIEALESKVAGSFRPDLIVLLDADARVCRDRLRGSGSLDRIESKPLEFHEAVRSAFLARLMKAPGAAVIDANQPATVVQAEIRSRVDNLVAARGLCHDPRGRVEAARRLIRARQPPSGWPALSRSAISASSLMSASSFKPPERLDLSKR